MAFSSLNSTLTRPRGCYHSRFSIALFFAGSRPRTSRRGDGESVYPRPHTTGICPAGFPVTCCIEGLPSPHAEIGVGGRLCVWSLLPFGVDVVRNPVVGCLPCLSRVATFRTVPRPSRRSSRAPQLRGPDHTKEDLARPARLTDYVWKKENKKECQLPSLTFVASRP